MKRRFSGILILAAFGPAACTAMEQYHFPQSQDKVPVPVIVAFSEKHPNDVIKSISEQKMFDGSTRYTFTIADSKNVERTVSFTSDAQPAEL